MNIEELKKLLFGGFEKYNEFVQKYGDKLFLNSKYKMEIEKYLDDIICNILENKNIGKYRNRKLREEMIVMAMVCDDKKQIASILASAARSAVLSTPKIHHFIKSNNQLYTKISKKGKYLK